MKILIFLCLILLVSLNFAANWVVLVAGSNSYSNYRHQSDVYHAFQILKRNGIPEDHIIVMHFDDIANNAQNPKKGTVINEPGGPNVYVNVPKDYIGKTVTPTNFLKILKGEDMGAGKKTIKSTEADNIFIFYTDHGATGIVAFPDGSVLHAKDLIDTLKWMHDNKKYHKLVFYLEACEAGSMFNGVLPNNLNIYATTAANPYVSSYACYYDSTYRAYLDDCYSINWMNDTEYTDVWTRTLDQQFVAVKKKTTQSPVCKYGDYTWEHEVIGNYQAEKTGMLKKNVKSNIKPDSVDSREVKIKLLEKLISEENNNKLREKYIQELDSYIAECDKLDVAWNSFIGMLNIKAEIEDSNDADHCYSPSAVINLDCQKESIQMAEKYFGLFTEYSLKYSRYIHYACKNNIPSVEMERAFSKISKIF